MLACIFIPLIGFCVTVFFIASSNRFEVNPNRHMSACVCFAIISLCCLIAGFWNAEYIIKLRKGFKVEAVQRGAAQWKVDDEGRTHFEWLLEKKSK